MQSKFNLQAPKVAAVVAVNAAIFTMKRQFKYKRFPPPSPSSRAVPQRQNVYIHTQNQCELVYLKSKIRVHRLRMQCTRLHRWNVTRMLVAASVFGLTCCAFWFIVNVTIGFRVKLDSTILKVKQGLIFREH